MRAARGLRIAQAVGPSRPLITMLPEIRVSGHSTETPTPGVTVLVCCHNSTARLPPTIECLARQVVAPDISWEVVIVDNASTDDTGAFAQTLWPPQSRVSFRVVQEPQLGLGYATRPGSRRAMS